MPAIFDRRLVAKLASKEYREAYAEDVTRVALARQVIALREQECRQWPQAELARKIHRGKTAIQNVEDPDATSSGLKILFDLAAIFDQPLWIEFMEWQEFLERSSEVQVESLERSGFDFQALAEAAEEEAVESQTAVGSGAERGEFPRLVWLNSAPSRPDVSISRLSDISINSGSQKAYSAGAVGSALTQGDTRASSLLDKVA